MTKTQLAKRAVRVWLASRGRTQNWLAKEIGVTHGYLSLVLSGSPCSSEVKARIKKVTGVDLDAPDQSEVGAA